MSHPTAPRRILWASLSLILLAAPVHAAAPAGAITFRAGTHPDFGRLVASPPHAAAPVITRDGDTLHIHMAAGGWAPARELPPNVLGVAARGDDATITLSPGATARIWRLGSRVVIDVYGRSHNPPPPGLQAQIFPPPPAQPATPRPPEPAPAPPPPPRVDPPPPVSSTSLTAQKLDGAAALLPFAKQTGAAAFRRGSRAVLVFDEAKPLDLSGLMAEPRLGAPELTLLPNATRVTFAIDRDRDVVLSRQPLGWAVRVVASPRQGGGMTMAPGSGAVALRVPAPATSLIIDDPDTGGKLLVGTVREAAPGLARAYRSAEFTALATWQGVAIEPASGRLVLRPIKDGFRLAADNPPALAAAIGPEAAAANPGVGRLTREVDFAPAPVPELLAALRRAREAASREPALDRTAARIRAAEAMLALGLDHEAEGVLRVAINDDPAQASNAHALALMDLARLLGGRTQSGTQSSPAASDEAALWHALADPGAPGHAAVIASRWPLLLGYPEPLRRRLLPLAAAALTDPAQRNSRDAVLAAAPSGTLAFERAAAVRDSGHTDAALAAFDALAGGRDRRDAARAARAALELRLRNGKLSATEAAAQLDRHLYDWRGGAEELATRLRLADLRAQAGAFRPALALLRETEALFPDAHDQVRDAERSVIAGLLRPGTPAKLSPLDLVAIAEEGAALLAERDSTSVLAPALVDKLLALDLPDRAEPILARLVAGTTAPVTRAALGVRLAALRLQRGDSAGASAVLDSTDAGSLGPELTAQRTIVRARIAAARGDTAAALTALAPLDVAEALDLAAGLHTARHEWREAAAVLARLAAHVIPGGRTPLDEAQQALLLRLASALSNAGDIAALRTLQAQQAERFPAGRSSDLFHVLTGPPVQSVNDLARSAQEVAAAEAAIGAPASR